MKKLRVIVANEPRSYREVVAAALQVLRPHVETICIEPDELDAELARSSPHLVILSRFSVAVEASVPAWVSLYPDGESQTVISIAGKRTTLSNIQSEDLLSILDQIAHGAEA